MIGRNGAVADFGFVRLSVARFMSFFLWGFVIGSRCSLGLWAYVTIERGSPLITSTALSTRVLQIGTNRVRQCISRGADINGPILTKTHLKCG
jgi:hypothetical protein